MAKRGLREFKKSASKKAPVGKGYELMKAMQKKPSAAKSRGHK
jgi:hypothetical protein